MLAFYLPQFHQIPENDAWWGTGFTDWVNVDRARPLYEGHPQPVEPGELGRYDLSDPDVMRSQAALAAEHGVDGFVMHHYWFDGRKLLDTPLRNLLDDPSIDFPFALCWANENWTRRWDGLDSDVLIAQSYSEGWADRFYDDILPGAQRPAVRHGRRSAAARPLSHRAHQERVCGDRTLEGACAATTASAACMSSRSTIPAISRGCRAASRMSIDGLVRLPAAGRHRTPVGQEPRPRDVPEPFKGDVYSYDAAVNSADLATTGPHGLRVHPGVMPGWDNTPRRGESAYVFHGANPLSFRRWLARAAAAAVGGGEPSLLFVNAWNEWAEGAHLEPDARFGRAYLEAVRDAVGVDERAPISTAPVPAESVAG